MWNHIYFTTLHSVWRYLIRHYKTVKACMIRATCLFALMYVFLWRYASFCVPQTLSFGNWVLINSSSYVYSCRCSSHPWIPSLDTDSFIKITCDWQGTCNRLFPTTKQIIDASLFSVTDYCWVYLGVWLFSIRVIIVMLSWVAAEHIYAVNKSYHEPQYVAHYQYECSIESTVLLSVILFACAFKGNN